MTTIPLSPRTTLVPRIAAALAAVLSIGCFHNPPGVEGVRGTAPSAGVFWTPPADQGRPEPLPAPALPADIAARVGQLGLTDVLDIALRNNTATTASWFQARAAAASYGAAKGQYYPTITVDGTVTTVKTITSGGRAAANQRFYGPSATLSWLLFDFGGRSGSVGDARAALLSADWAHNATVQNVVLGVAQAYFGYMGTKALLAAQQTTLKEAQTNLDAANGRHNVGLATIADVLQAKTALSQAQLAVETSEGQVQTTRGGLALSMGLPANIPYDIEPPSDSSLPLEITDSVEALIERAVRERPDLQAARADVRAAQARISVARARALPSLEVGGTDGETYFFNNSVPGNSYSATLTLHIPIFSGWSDVYDTRAASATAQATAAQARGLEQQVIYQVFSSYYGLRTSAQLVRTSADLLASATASEQVALGRYRAGASALLDLLTAEAALAGARAQQIQARFTWYVSLAQLSHDAGVLGLDGTGPLHLRADTTGTNR